MKRFVELQGHTIRVGSDPGHGSTFTFSIPLAVAGRSDVRPPHPASDPVPRE